MIGKLDQALAFQSSALKLRSERQQVLSANIANADTPNYKAVDFDFSAALASATGAASGATRTGTLATSSAGHTAGNGNFSNLSVPIQFRNASQASVDGNTVEMDAERAQFADNAVRYEAALKFLNGQIKTMLSAIQG
jgi:flagellar basal-body rod protein FlgB